MAKVYKSSIFTGGVRGWGDGPTVRTRMQFVAVHPPLDHDLSWHGANRAGVTSEDFGTIEIGYSDDAAKPRLGSLVLLRETCGEDESEVAFEAAGGARLDEAVTNIAALACMGTTSNVPAAEHNPHFDAVGMPIIFPGSIILAPAEAPPTQPA